MVQSGIYGYHVYNTVKYFDGQTVDVGFTGFCTEAGDKLNEGPYSGDFGCVGDINDLKFPMAGLTVISLIKTTSLKTIN